MAGKTIDGLNESGLAGLGKTFMRLGRIGLWMQIVVGSLPLLLMVFVFVFARTPDGPRAGLPLVEHLTAASLLLLVFTIFWFRRYTQVGRNLVDPESMLSLTSVMRTAWTGIVAGSIAILLSLLLMMVETGNLLFNFLKAPQGGVPVFQTTGSELTGWVSTIDMASLMALTLFMLAELIVLVFSLWLLYRTMQEADEFPASIYD